MWLGRVHCCCLGWPPPAVEVAVLGACPKACSACVTPCIPAAILLTPAPNPSACPLPADLAPECASAYFRYGSCLLYQAQDSSDVFGASMKEGAGEEEAEDDEEEEAGAWVVSGLGLGAGAGQYVCMRV